MPAVRTAPKIVSLRGAGKRYRRGGAWVLDGVEVALAAGTAVELRGSNGSGKSTLLRLLAGATHPSAGERAAADGLRVGFAPEDLPPPAFLARDFLHHHVRLRQPWGYAAASGREEIATLAGRLDCAALLDERMPALSKGSLRKMVLIQALLGGPQLLVLDEPFDGLDREAQGVLGEIVEERRCGGAAIVFSDHRAETPLRPNAVWEVREGRVSEVAP